MKRKIAGITRRDNGTYMCRFTINGKRYTVYGKTVKECREKEAKKRQEIEAGTYKPGRTLTIKEYSERWLHNKEGHCKESTRRRIRYELEAICRAPIDGAGRTFGELRIDKVEVQNVRELQAALLDAGKATASVNKSISVLSQMLSSAVIERDIIWNPAQGVRSLKRTEEQARDTIHRALTRDETAAFLEGAAGSWYYNMYILLLNTGLRFGEAGALSIAHITGKGLKICRSLTVDAGGHTIIGDDTKTAAGIRYVPLNDAARQALDDQRAIEAALRGDKVISMDAPIFKSPRGGIIRDSNANEDIAKICRAAGIEKFTCHAFRDTFATRCVESGMPVKELQEILGHTDVKMTLGLYTHAMDESKERHLQAVNFL